ncbi:MAG: hypothetical protein R3C20_19495 [Planctomycetaceae bacterium]
MKLNLLVVAAIICLVTLVSQRETIAAADVPLSVNAYADAGTIPMLAQAGEDDGYSPSTRVRSRSVRGLISLVLLGVAGVGWIFKKLFGGGES